MKWSDARQDTTEGWLISMIKMKKWEVRKDRLEAIFHGILDGVMLLNVEYIKVSLIPPLRRSDVVRCTIHKVSHCCCKKDRSDMMYVTSRCLSFAGCMWHSKVFLTLDERRNRCGVMYGASKCPSFLLCCLLGFDSCKDYQSSFLHIHIFMRRQIVKCLT